MWRKRFTTLATSSSSSIRALKEKKWDAVVIGGGHNGLTAAAYLARAGLSVAVLERRHIVGGAAVTEEIIPGFKFSRCSYLQSLLRPAVIKELQLERHGLKMLNGSSSSFTPCVDGRYLFQGMDEEENLAEISKFSKRDAEAYPRYEKQLEEFCKFLDPILDSIPPESLHGVSSLSGRFKNQKHKLDFWIPLFRRAISLGQKDLVYVTNSFCWTSWSFCYLLHPRFCISGSRYIHIVANSIFRMCFCGLIIGDYTYTDRRSEGKSRNGFDHRKYGK
ncbi:Pyridine nucleotide-disulfide oxidoreductase domain-containing protein 2 [Linum perenne]